MYGSATSETAIADCTRVWTPSRSSASWSVNAFSSVASIGVVRGRAVHALGRGGHPAVDVPRTDDDRELGPRVVHGDDLLADRGDAVRVDAVLAPAQQRLAGKLQERATEGAGVSVATLAVAFRCAPSPRDRDP